MMTIIQRSRPLAVAFLALHAALPSVLGQGTDAVQITHQPLGMRATPGEEVQLRCEFSGPATQVKWLRDGVVISTEAASGGASVLSDTPLLLAPSGLPQEVTYTAQVVSAVTSVESEPAIVSASSGQYGPFMTKLRGSAVLGNNLGAGPQVKLGGSGAASFELGDASVCETGFDSLAQKALNDPNTTGEITLEATASSRKGWDGTVKGSTSTVVRIQKPKDQSTSSTPFTFDTTIFGKGASICFFRGMQLLKQVPASEVKFRAGAMMSQVLLDRGRKKRERDFKTHDRRSYMELSWPAPTRVEHWGDPHEYLCDAIVISQELPAPLNATTTSQVGDGVANFKNLTVRSQIAGDPIRIGDVKLGFLRCEYDDAVTIDGVEYSGADFCTPPCGPPPPAAYTTILALNERSQRCITPPIVGSWDDPGLMVSPLNATDTTTPFGVTLQGATMEGCDVALRLKPPTEGSAEGACFNIKSWAWQTASGSTTPSVSNDPAFVRISPDAVGGALITCEGEASWRVRFRANGTVVGASTVSGDNRLVANVPSLTLLNAAQVTAPDTISVVYPLNTPISYMQQGVPKTVACDTIEMDRITPGFTTVAHAAVRLEACCLPPFEIIGGAVRHRVSQWGDALVTTGVDSPGATSSSPRSANWDIKAMKRYFRPESPSPLGLAVPNMPILTTAGGLRTRSNSSQATQRVIGGFNSSRSNRQALLDFAPCPGFEVGVAIDQSSLSTAANPPRKRARHIRTWESKSAGTTGETTNELAATLTFEDTTLNPEDGANLLPIFTGATSYREKAKADCIAVAEFSGVTGLAAIGLPDDVTFEAISTPTGPQYHVRFAKQLVSLPAAGTGAAPVLIDELILIPEMTSGGAKPSSFVACEINGTELTDLVLTGCDLYQAEVKRGPRALVSAVAGASLLAGGPDDDCDGLDDSCSTDGWVFANRIRGRETGSGMATGRRQYQRLSSVTFGSGTPGTSAASEIAIHTGEAEQATFSFGVNNLPNTKGRGLDAGLISATFDRPTGAQDWSLRLQKRPPYGCILRPELPVPVSGYRCTVWDGGDGNGGCTPSGEVFLSGALEVDCPILPDGFGFRCDMARVAEPDIVRVEFPFPVSISLNGQSMRASSLQIAPVPLTPVAPGPITKLTISAAAESGGLPVVKSAIALPLASPRFTHTQGTSATGTPALNFSWGCPSTRPFRTSDLNGWSEVSAAAITELPDGTKRYEAAYPPPDRAFFQLIDRGWEWPPLPSAE